MTDLTIAAELCRKFEGFRSKPYLCPAGIPTIGYGSTAYEDGRRVTLADAPVTKERAEELLMHELHHQYLPGVLRCCPILGAANNLRRLNAIVDFAYNLGVGRLQTSTLRRRINALDWEGAQEELAKWVRGGGRVLPGLVKRRQCESLLLV